ncbi:unnamed protein product [Gordionus sp. m RMFG-2023]
MIEYTSTLKFKHYFPTKSILRNRDRNDDLDYSNDNSSYSNDSVENNTYDNKTIKFALNNNRVRFFDKNKSSSNILKCKSDSEICKIVSPKLLRTSILIGYPAISTYQDQIRWRKSRKLRQLINIKRIRPLPTKRK